MITNRNNLFVEEYLSCWNASEAARRAGYKSKANVQGARLLANVSIQEKIKERLSEKAMEANEVLARLAEHARGDFSPFLTQQGAIDLTTDEAKQKLFLLKKVKVITRRRNKRDDFEEFSTEIELHDPQAALVHIGRHYGLFSDKIDHSGNVALTLYVKRDRSPVNRTDDPSD